MIAKEEHSSMCLKNRISIKKTVIFFLIFILLFLTIQVPFYKGQEYGYQYKNVYEKLHNFERFEGNSDVIFLGDSVGWAAFSPAELWRNIGVSSYNLCTSGQWLMDTKAIVNHLNNKMPKIMVLEGSMLFEHPNKFKNIFAKYLPLFHYHDFYRFSFGTKSHLEKTLGFDSSDAVQAYTNGESYMSQTTKNDEMKQDSVKYLDYILTKCKENNTEVVIVTLPNSKGWNSSRNAYLNNLCKDRNIPFIDFNLLLNDVNFDWQTDTRDAGEHMNNSGSEKIMNYLANYFQENYHLVDCRNNVNYQLWNEMFGKGE